MRKIFAVALFATGLVGGMLSDIGTADAQYGRRGYYRPLPQPRMVPRLQYQQYPMGYNYGVGQTAHITPYYCGGGYCYYYRSR